MKEVVVLGSTGSLGKQALEVVKKHSSQVRVVGICANKNEELLKLQAEEFSPKSAVLTSKEGDNKINELIEEGDIIVNVISGTAGISPTVETLKRGKRLLLGNKESLVAEGEKVMELNNSQIIPIDSEHNAIFEIFKKFPDKKVKNIVIPCSGGPFLGRTDTENFTLKEALAHPKWQMGNKITIESATLLNKGLEIIEAHYLFNIPLEQIKVTIHPECQIHGIVEFANETYSYTSQPDMREHIENALLHAIDEKTSGQEKIYPLESFQIREPDHETFPGIKLTLQAFQRSHRNMTKFLEDEEQAIKQFLDGKFELKDIYDKLGNYKSQNPPPIAFF